MAQNRTRHMDEYGRPLPGREVMARPFTDHGVPYDPWTALLDELNRTTDMLRRLDEKLSTADDDHDLEPRGRLYHWVKERHRERRHLLTVTRMAIQMGIAERLVHKAELDAVVIVGVFEEALGALTGDLNEDQEVRLRSALGMALTAAANRTTVIEGESV